MASSVPSASAKPLSVAGLLAVLFVMAASHVVVARYDMLALDVLGSDCIFIGGDTKGVCAADASQSPDPSAATDDPSDRADRLPRHRPPRLRLSAPTSPRSPSRRGTARSA